MEDLIVFALPAKLPKEIITHINYKNKIIAPNGKTKLKKFAKELSKYKFIIGIGDYSGKEQSRLRIELQAHEFKKVLHLNNFLKPSKNSIYSLDIGNSYCNYISFQITVNYPEINYSFIHIPKKMEINKASDEINQMIERFLSDKL